MKKTIFALCLACAFAAQAEECYSSGGPNTRMMKRG